MEGYLHRIWQNYEISLVSFLPNGLFVVRFAKEEHKWLVLAQGMFLFDGKPIILRCWEPNVKITKMSVKTVPIWVKLVGLDLKFWGVKCLEKLASLVGKFVRVDDRTLDKLLLGYAKVMVEVEVDQHFPDRIRFDDENGQEVTVLLEYDWLPITCQKCKGIGHSTNMCRGRAKVYMKPANGSSIPAPKQVWRKKPDAVVNLDPKEYPVLKSPRQGGGGPENRSEGVITPANTPANIPQISMFTPARILTRMTRHESRIPGGKDGDFVTSINAELTKGLNSDTKQRDVKWYLHQSEVVLFGLLETRVKPGSLNNVANNMCNGWDFVTNHNYHAGGRIWVLWKNQYVKVDIIEMDSQYIHLKVKDKVGNHIFYATFVYGFNKIEERVPLWNALKSWSINDPWVVLGDFNNVKYSSERVGKPVKDAEMLPFQEVLDECELHDMKTTGAFFTWTNKHPSETRVFSRIDRVVVNTAWLDVWPDYFAHFAPEGSFDHCPCAISCEADNIPRRKPFKFFNMWSRVPDFHDIVKKNWSVYIHGSLMFRVVQKMKLLKPEFKILNRNLFSDVERNAEIAYTILLECQRNLQANPRDLTLMDIEYQAKESYLLLAQARDDYLRQKSKCQWAKDGDTNSAMFHKLLGSNAVTTGFYPHIAEKGPKVENADWDTLWRIIQSDICKAIRDFFLSGQMLKQLNNTNLVLIPKTENPISVKEFRPIACCNTLYKVISKLLCNRLAAILPNLINSSQSAFIKGRSIMGNILISQDLVRLYTRKSMSPRCMLKVDLRKAYDSIEWKFVHQMLQSLNFPPKFIQWLMNCITTTSYSIVLNGQSHGFFPGKRGLRQGDPLSPLLFTLCMEYLSRLLNEAYINSVMTFMEVFHCFSSASGLQISNEKSDIILNGLTPGVEDDILKYTGFKKGTLPFKYLGVQISHKRLTKLDCNVLVDRMLLRIRGWNKRKISYSGRLVLVKSVLATIHNYWSQIFILPMGVIDRIKALCRNFLWEGGEGYSKAPLVAWSTLCKGKEYGGLGKECLE
ncbi:uncharacterized protein LOC141641547 [Silene latifolia]|uniref:uncharacterized protein LOC141641547 n=1 Tax=Silene latifolia TaxID=37657 RepID=UPI003D773A63